jgi:hypothetical protein
MRLLKNNGYIDWNHSIRSNWSNRHSHGSFVQNQHGKGRLWWYRCVIRTYFGIFMFSMIAWRPRCYHSFSRMIRLLWHLIRQKSWFQTGDTLISYQQ